MERVFKNILFLIFAVFMLAGCAFGFLDNDDNGGNEGSEDTSWYDYDEVDGIKYYYSDSSTDSLEWMEYYDFVSGDCVFAKHVTDAGTLVWSEVYGYDTEGNLIMKAHFGSDNLLDYFIVTVWDDEKAVQQIDYGVEYNAESTAYTSAHEGYRTWTFDGNDDMTNAASFSGSGALEWAFNFAYTYDGNNLIYDYAARYDETAARTGYYESHYEVVALTDTVEVSTKTGYGDSSWGSNYSSSYSCTSFPIASTNTHDRNDSDLVAPVEGTDYTVPAVTPPTLTDTSLPFGWMVLMEYDPWGYTKAVLNENYLPEYLERSAPDFLDETIATEMEYEPAGDIFRLISKEVTYGSTVVLDVALTYDDPDAPAGCLNRVDLSGDGLLLPLSFAASYFDDGVPESLTVSSNGTTLYNFTYTYADLESFDPTADYVQQVATLTMTEREGALIKYFTFDYDGSARMVTVTTWDSEAMSTQVGSLEIAYDEEGALASFTAKDGDGNEQWQYEYGYEDVVTTVDGVVSTAEDAVGDIAQQIQVMIGETYLELDEDLELTPENIGEFFTESGIMDIALTFLIDMDLDQYLPIDL